MASELDRACQTLECESPVASLTPFQFSDNIGQPTQQLVNLRRYCHARILGLSHADAWNMEENMEAVG